MTMDRLGGLVQAPMNCTTFLCLTFLEVGLTCASPALVSGRRAGKHNKLSWLFILSEPFPFLFLKCGGNDKYPHCSRGSGDPKLFDC